MLDFILLLLKPMMMMVALTLMLLLKSSVVVAYAAVDDANADAKMPKVARHLVGGVYVVLWMPPLLPMHMLLMQLMRADACDDVMLQSVYMRLFVSSRAVQNWFYFTVQYSGKWALGNEGTGNGVCMTSVAWGPSGCGARNARDCWGFVGFRGEST